MVESWWASSKNGDLVFELKYKFQIHTGALLPYMLCHLPLPELEARNSWEASSTNFEIR